MYYCLKARSIAPPAADTNGTVSDYRVSLKAPLRLEVRDHFEVGLMKGHLPITWNTISEELGNDQFYVNGALKTIPAGHHTLTTLQDAMNTIIDNQLPFPVTPPTNHVILTPLYYNGRVRMQIVTAGLQIDFILPRNLGKVLGFDGTPHVGARIYDGTSLPDFTGTVREINVECDLVDPNYCRNNQQQSRALVRVTPPGGLPYSTFNVVNTDTMWLPISNTTEISDVHIRVTNQDLVPIKFQDGEADFCVCIRKVSRDRPTTVPRMPQ